MSESNDIVDLSDTLADHSNLVIDLLDSDDSLSDDMEDNIFDSVPRSRAASMKNGKPTVRPTAAADRAKKELEKQKSSSLSSDAASTSSEKENKIGECPICWDEFGKQPLASTKCGHVYCLQCIKKCIKVEKKCPTCRQILMGSTPYHPLYLFK